MSKLKVDQFVDLVKKSGLVDDDRLNQALSGVDPSVNDSGIIASMLTKAGLLTEWHSEKLLQGRHKGFYLGKYKLLNHIGTGGMGAVYLAEHQVMRHRVAIKLLPQHMASNTAYLERFHQEARALAHLNHPNIVRAYDVDHDGNIHYLVMEFVDGTDLQAIVSRSGPMAFATAAEYVRQSGEGLSYAHRSGLIHRDIKPANLLIDKTGTIKILDMGLARFCDESQGSLTREYDQKMIGTVDYLAPEQAIDSHAVDARADIYSLGCTLYFLLTGDAPFPQGTIPQRLLQHQSAEPADIRTIRPDAPQALINICSKMMAKNPADRFQSGDEVAQALADWLGGRAVDSFDHASAPAGPSLNEDLTLAPLDDEPAGRKSAGKDSSPGDPKLSGAGKSGVKGPGASGIKGPSSSIHKGPASGIKNGQSSGIKKGESSGTSKPKSGVKTPSVPNLAKEVDLMDQLLAAPALPPAAPLKSGAYHTTHRHAGDDRMKRVLITLGMGLGGAGVIVGLILLLIWYTGGHLW